MEKNWKGNRRRWLFTGIFFLAVAGIFLGYAAIQEIQKADARELYGELQEKESANKAETQESKMKLEINETQKTNKTDESEKEEIAAENPKGTDSDSTIKLPVAILEIQKELPDVYSWIEIPGTKVDYPIVQHPEDNSYYLDKTPDGQSNKEGSVFSEKYNKKDFSDPVTVLYGHNMKNGDMFGELHRYEDRDFFREHRTINIYTEKQRLEYEIFAATLFDDRHILQSYDFTDKEVFMQYIRDIRGVHDMRSYFDTSVNVNSQDHILILSTCHGLGSHYRYLVQAILVDEEK